MVEIQLGIIEAKFADIIWNNEPITSTELVKICQTEFNWKRTTTHTVLRRLCDKGLFQNDRGKVTSLLSRENFYSLQSKKYIDDTFNGSLPAFISAFTQNTTISREEAEEIRKMIDKAEEVSE